VRSPSSCRSRLFGLGASAQLGADPLVVGFRGGPFLAGSLQVDPRLLHAQLEVAALGQRALPTLGGVGEALRGHREITLELADLEAGLRQVVDHGAAMPFRAGTRVGRLLARGLGPGQSLARGGDRLRQLGVATLEADGVVGELDELALGERDRDRELLLGEGAMPLGLSLLARQRAEL